MNPQTNIQILPPNILETLPNTPLHKLISHLEKFNEVERVYTTKTDAQFEILNIELVKATIKNSTFVKELLNSRSFCGELLRDYPILSVRNLEIKDYVFMDRGKSSSDNYMQPLHHDFLNVLYRNSPIQTFYNPQVNRDLAERQAPTLFALHKNYDPIAVAYAHKFIESITDQADLSMPVGELFRSLKRAARGQIPLIFEMSTEGFSENGEPLTYLDSPTKDQNLSFALQELLFRLCKFPEIQKIIGEIYELSKNFIYEHKWGRDSEILFFNNNLLVHGKGLAEAQPNEQPIQIFVDLL